MSQKFARIEKSTTERFLHKRKLFLVPNMYEPPSISDDGSTLLRKYWRQVQAQITNLESGLGQVQHIYTETITQHGQGGLHQIESSLQQTYPLIKEAHLNGAVIHATENEETLLQLMDLQRLLIFPLASSTITTKLTEWHHENIRQRWDHIANLITETLRINEVGLLIINERHQIQFPSDIEVIYVSPPALDAYRRWLMTHLAEQQRQAIEAAQSSDLGQASIDENGTP